MGTLEASAWCVVKIAVGSEHDLVSLAPLPDEAVHPIHAGFKDSRGELAQFLADLFHEGASPERPAVIPLTDSDLEEEA